MTKHAVGIDFGTTNSLVALVVGAKMRSLVNEQDNLPHPSVVWYRGTNVIVGRDARKYLDTIQDSAAQGFVRSPKMKLRRDGPVPENSMRPDSRGEAESAHHPMRCLRSSTYLERMSQTCSSRGAGLKSRTSFSVISSTSP
jgi:molecular chaperone DnaK (HSP70)